MVSPAGLRLLGSSGPTASFDPTDGGARDSTEAASGERDRHRVQRDALTAFVAVGLGDGDPQDVPQVVSVISVVKDGGFVLGAIPGEGRCR